LPNIDILSVVLIAIGLSMDCFAVAIGGSVTMKSLSVWKVLRTSLSFGIFQTIMPVIGWFAGQTVVNLISGYDHWIAFGLLAYVGGKMVCESFHGENEDESQTDITSGFALISLSIATSIDALAVGLSFAFIEVGITEPSIIIGVVCFAITATGFIVGRTLGAIFGKRAELFGGLVLIGIGIRILVEHLTG